MIFFCITSGKNLPRDERKWAKTPYAKDADCLFLKKGRRLKNGIKTEDIKIQLSSKSQFIQISCNELTPRDQNTTLKTGKWIK